MEGWKGYFKGFPNQNGPRAESFFCTNSLNKLLPWTLCVNAWIPFFMCLDKRNCKKVLRMREISSLKIACFSSQLVLKSEIAWCVKRPLNYYCNCIVKLRTSFSFRCQKMYVNLAPKFSFRFLWAFLINNFDEYIDEQTNILISDRGPLG